MFITSHTDHLTHTNHTASHMHILITHMHIPAPPAPPALALAPPVAQQ